MKNDYRLQEACYKTKNYLKGLAFIALVTVCFIAGCINQAYCKDCALVIHKKKMSSVTGYINAVSFSNKQLMALQTQCSLEFQPMSKEVKMQLIKIEMNKLRKKLDKLK
jgi:hypothetical protein